MTLTPEHRARMRALWRQLAQAAVARDVEGLRALTREAVDWPSPVDTKGGAFALFSLARLAHGFTGGTAEERRRMAPALSLMGALAGDILDATDPAEPPRTPPQLPFRADLDG